MPIWKIAKEVVYSESYYVVAETLDEAKENVKAMTPQEANFAHPEITDDPEVLDVVMRMRQQDLSHEAGARYTCKQWSSGNDTSGLGF